MALWSSNISFRMPGGPSKSAIPLTSTAAVRTTTKGPKSLISAGGGPLRRYGGDPR